MGQIEDIQVFIRVVEAGGISRAAEQLNIAKSAVSRRLSELEGRLKTKLIQRTTRKFNLTDEGRLYYQRAIRLVDEFKELDSSILRKNGELEGVLSISLPLTFGLLHMSPVIDAFLNQHPKLSIKVELSDSRVNLVEEGVDVAFRIGELHDSSIQARKIVPIRMVICASPDYLQKHSLPKNLSDLAEVEFLQYSLHDSNDFQVINPLGVKETFVTKGRFRSNNGDFLKSMAVA
ncbi:MAG: LysR family transcriptional regulator, partial [Thiomicrorhabdus sp.]|nr:LysR family transcriptional regulator [Thiomicrorhabdus sp.]